MKKVTLIILAVTGFGFAASADCSFGVDPTTGQYTQICGGPETGNQSSGGCYFGIDPTTGQYTQVCR